MGGKDKDGNAKETKQPEKTKEVKLDKPSLIPIVSQEQSRVTRAKSKSLKGNEEPVKSEAPALPVKPIVAPDPARVLKDITLKPAAMVTRRSKSLAQKAEKETAKKLEPVPPASTSGSEEDSIYQTAVSTPVGDHEENAS